MATAQAQHSPVYKLKRIDFFGRKVPIALQNENGPCPLLAIANILLLKKQIELPEHAPDISQNRLVSLVAGHLLDANDEQKVGKGLPEEYKANLRKNVADAIGILSKLTTGIDVNVRFHDVKGFEFTDEIAIFDLMDISLVHGWLVDPQDAAAAASLGHRSYNEVVEQLVMILGDATPKRLITPQLSRRTSGFSTPRRTSSGLGTVAPSELLSPTEITSTPGRPSEPQQGPTKAHPSSGLAPSHAAVAGATEAGESQPGSSSEAHATPTGALTSTESQQPFVSEAAQAGGPTGSLVSAQQPAALGDSAPASHTQSPPKHSSHAAQPQIQTAMISPAAEMASRAYPLPAAPLEGGGLTTPQSSSKFDAHIITAPTPYPSLASELSQATNSLVSSQGSAMNSAFPPAGLEPSGSPIAVASNDGKSRFAPSDALKAKSNEDDSVSHDQFENSTDAPAQASDAPSRLHLTPDEAHTNAAEDSAEASASQDVSPMDVHPSAENLSIADLKLDTADDEQLQLALAISLGQQQAEEAQTLAQGFSGPQQGDSLDQSAAGSSQMPNPASADPALSMPGKDADGSHVAATEGSPALPGASAGTPGMESLAASTSAADSSAEVPRPQPGPGMDEANPSEAVPTTADPVALLTSGTTGAADAQQPKGNSGADVAPPVGQQGMMEEHQQNLLSPHDAAPAGAADEKSQQLQPGVQTPSGTATQGAGPRTRTTSEQEERSKAAAQAHIIQEFLDNSSSQLTFHGLASLREGLRPNELAVFFRNNHFNTIFLHKGVVHILVTDQGYEFEKNVVWEKLDDLMGNTQFLKADFSPYGSNSLAEQASDAADLVQAAFAGVGPNQRPASNDAGVVDADFALALQLQEEEQRRAARDQQSRQQAQQQQQQGQRNAGQSRQQPSSTSTRSSQAKSGSHGRPPSGRSADQGAQSFTNPIMQRQPRQGGSQQAQQQQQAERSSMGSSIGKWFSGWGSKK